VESKILWNGWLPLFSFQSVKNFSAERMREKIPILKAVIAFHLPLCADILSMDCDLISKNFNKTLIIFKIEYDLGTQKAFNQSDYPTFWALKKNFDDGLNFQNTPAWKDFLFKSYQLLWIYFVTSLSDFEIFSSEQRWNYLGKKVSSQGDVKITNTLTLPSKIFDFEILTKKTSDLNFIWMEKNWKIFIKYIFMALMFLV